MVTVQANLIHLSSQASVRLCGIPLLITNQRNREESGTVGNNMAHIDLDATCHHQSLQRSKHKQVSQTMKKNAFVSPAVTFCACIVSVPAR